MQWRRILAFGFDALLGYLCALALFTGLGANQSGFLALGLAPLLSCLITLFWHAFSAQHGPGKPLFGLTLSGNGCLPCRQMRLWLPLSLPALAILLIPDIALKELIVGAVTGAIVALALPAIVSGYGNPHWARVTGLQTQPKD